MKDGEPWFVGKDVAEALGYKNTKDALISHVAEDDKRIIQRSEIATIENHLPKEVFPMNFVSVEIPNRGLTAINESGLYSLIFGSKLETAKKFKRWVTSEVLPAIRKTGGYVDQSRSEIELRLFSNKKGTIFYCPLIFIFYTVLLFSPTCPVPIYIRNYHIYSQSFHYQEIL